MKRRFNDDFYCKSVEEWENDVVPSRAIGDYMLWAVRLLPVAAALGTVFAGRDWQKWVVILAVMYPLVSMFVFLEELNENVRFVRHQLRVFRVAVRRTSDTVSKYRNPERNLTLFDLLTTVDGEWEDPT